MKKQNRIEMKLTEFIQRKHVLRMWFVHDGGWESQTKWLFPHKETVWGIGIGIGRFGFTAVVANLGYFITFS